MVSAASKKSRKGGKKSTTHNNNKQQRPSQNNDSSKTTKSGTDESTTRTMDSTTANNATSTINNDDFHHHEHLTNTNTDSTCLDTQKPRIFRYFYQYNLWTGLYMLNPNEQAGFHFFGWLFTICVILYMYSFLRGFLDGFRGMALMEDQEEDVFASAESLMMN